MNYTVSPARRLMEPSESPYGLVLPRNTDVFQEWAAARQERPLHPQAYHQYHRPPAAKENAADPNIVPSAPAEPVAQNPDEQTVAADAAADEDYYVHTYDGSADGAPVYYDQSAEGTADDATQPMDVSGGDEGTFVADTQQAPSTPHDAVVNPEFVPNTPVSQQGRPVEFKTEPLVIPQPQMATPAPSAPVGMYIPPPYYRIIYICSDRAPLCPFATIGS